MSNQLSVTINDVELPIKEYQGQKVVTLKEIDAVHNRPEGTARKRFNDNKKHFIEGVDYFKITPSEFRTAFGGMDSRQSNDVTLLTESGYLMLVKSFTDDLAWDVQRQLVNTYFQAMPEQRRKAAKQTKSAETPEEAQFAADHLNFVYWFLNNKNLDKNEWFDVVIFRYLLAVKQYICISDLQRYSFACIAYKAMTSAISNECRSQKIRIQTVSLYHPAPGTDNLVYADMITTENLNFIPYIYEKEGTMRILAPKACGKPKGKEVKAIEKFLDSDGENLCLEYETAQQARSKIKTIGSHRKRLARLYIYYEAHQVKNCIYITKGKEARAK